MSTDSTYPLTTTTTHDIPGYLPDDDSAVYEGRRRILNRIDEGAEYGCSHIIYDGPLHELQPEYCELPEHDPFTDRCWDHTPGNMK